MCRGPRCSPRRRGGWPRRRSSRPPFRACGPRCGLEGAVIVTFQVADVESFRVRLTDSDDIGIAYELLAGHEAPAIPNGRIVRGPNDVNVGHPWALDPTDFEFAGITMELCDGLPSMVDDPSFASERYCPWAAKVIAVEPAPGS